MDSRTSSILINLDLNLNKNFIASNYETTAEKIEESCKFEGKTYTSLRSTVMECYLTGSLKYGNNFVM